MSNINAGIVRKGDQVEMWLARRKEPLTLIASKDGVYSLPSDCYQAKVNGKLVVKLDNNQLSEGEVK